MTSEAPDINWQDILDKFYSYDGTIVDFCKQNNIKPYQLYYQRKRANRNDAPEFHAINLKENFSNKANNEEINSPKSNLASDIKIEIGKATIHVPGNNKEALSNIFKVIMQSC
ncbi:hypothetical protein [Sporosalibacterium faouarense]|uniref:hypothetical protein n=1 Tax=Sporosalibacterium faouarense TaxID=516123 RepID=UPI00192B5C80|nr:hypothetical protein [Sporosalibacterium faouarense]